MKLKTTWQAAGLFLCACLALACDRNDDVWDGEYHSTVDHSFAESEFSSIGNLFDYEARSDTNLYGKAAATNGFYCPAANVNVIVTSSSTATVEIDFGSATNCVDGRTRTGKLIANFNGKWKDAGSTVVITPDGYSVEGFAFHFTQTITMNGRDPSTGLLSWETVVDNAVLTDPVTLSQISWESTRTTTWAEGEGDLDLSNNVYLVSGNSSGTSRTGRDFTVLTTQDLRVELSCPTITEGVLEITPAGLQTRTIDYGNGSCDGVVTLGIGSFQTQINLI